MPQGSPGHYAAQEPAPAQQWLAHSLPEYTLAGRFQQLRAHFASAARLGLDHDRLHRLIKWSGQRLAVVRYAEAPLPGPPGRKAAVWQSPDGEILFGIQPHSDHAYWSALLQLARQRREQVASCRLVLFSSAAAPMDPALWLMHPDEAAAARARFLDIQTLDHAELATLYATDEVLREAERGTLAVGSSDAFAAMAPYLEFFWKRLTRPLRSG